MGFNSGFKGLIKNIGETIMDKEKKKTKIFRGKNCPYATSWITYCLRTSLRFDAYFRDDKTVTTRLSSGTETPNYYSVELFSTYLLIWLGVNGKRYISIKIYYWTNTYTLSTYAWIYEYALGNLYNHVQVLGDICVGLVERLLCHSQREIFLRWVFRTFSQSSQWIPSKWHLT